LGTLYLVATPIGNLEDITLRALRILREVALVAAEDTRTARKLMFHHDIRARVVSYNEHNMRTRTPQILKALDDSSVALISEAGTPGISDPGYELVRSAIAAGHEVSPIPGPAAPVAAVIASGLPSREFIFIGFLPRRSSDRRRLFDSLRHSPHTIVVFESPHRLQAAFQDALAVLGDRRIAVCRELTKLHEEIFRGTVSSAIEHFTEPRGEFTIVIEGAAESPQDHSDDDLRARLKSLRESGISARDAAARLAAETGLPRRRLYTLALTVPPARPS
jgi:16S rRNA (cytidine1402-2'-O)-methyltransferase